MAKKRSRKKKGNFIVVQRKPIPKSTRLLSNNLFNLSVVTENRRIRHVSKDTAKRSLVRQQKLQKRSQQLSKVRKAVNPVRSFKEYLREKV